VSLDLSFEACRDQSNPNDPLVFGWLSFLSEDGFDEGLMSFRALSGRWFDGF
jgi:hypothetical protein